jgi:hypothetical protein
MPYLAHLRSLLKRLLEINDVSLVVELLQSEGVSWKTLCGPIWVNMTIVSRDGSSERGWEALGEQLLDFRGESRKGHRLAFAPAMATLLLYDDDGLVVLE